MKAKNLVFLKYGSITFLFLAVFACSTTKKISGSTNSNTISFEQIKADIARLEGEEFEFAVSLTEEINNVHSEDELIDVLMTISRFQFDNHCLVYVLNRNFMSFSPLPLEEDRFSNLLLLYIKDGVKWKLDTAFTTYPDFEQIASSEYFLAGSQRCIEGRCAWYNAIMKVNKSNQLEKVFDYENFDVEMYLYFILPDNREAVINRIGEEIKSETEIMEYVWNGEELQKIHLKETTGILQAVENDSLIIKSDTLFRTIQIND